MHVGWIWVKHGLAKAAPFRWALQMAVTFRGHGVRGEIEHVGVTAGGENHCVRRVAGHLSSDEVSNHDSDRPAIFDHDVEHLGTDMELHFAGVDLTHQRRVGTKKELLSGGAPGVKSPRHLGAPEGAIVEKPAVLAGERNSLGSGLVDDVQRNLGQTMDVGFPTPIVAALHRVVEQAVHRVAVVVIVLRGVDPALGRDRVGTARRIVEGEYLDLVAEFAERGSG